jgi:type III restriction enzyme
MFDLKIFQSESAALMSARYAYFANHPDRPRKGNRPRPFFQALSALTGAGKTPILAEAVSQMRTHLTSEPIIFWMSKAKSVVAQTYTNFSAGGKYSSLVEDFRVVNVSELTPKYIEDGTTPLIILATTGLFNNKEQSEGSLNIYKQDKDLFGNQSPWERLISRKAEGRRRPLFIVYDEGHNLSEQQTNILAELEPEAYLLASATLKLPDSFNKSVIKNLVGWFEEITDKVGLNSLQAMDDSGMPDSQRFITTSVRSEKVVDAQLVKKAVQFDGTTAPMEKCLDDLMERSKKISMEIDVKGLGFKPKAIYVCKTNIADDGEKDDHTKPFEQRKAPPIRIWRYLVEQHGVEPKDIAIYANLAFDGKNKPDFVNLFSKGDKDFDEFTAGDFKHIIFNLSLQEGWDDPACYLAYVDKSMGSSIQVEQIIGRVLRQYGAEHYDSPLLNSAHFFLRVDNESVFTEAINGVKAKLKAEGAPIDIVNYYGGGRGGSEDLLPKEDVQVELHQIYVESEAARDRIKDLISDFPNYSEGSNDTLGQAHQATQVIDMSSLGSDAKEAEWVAKGHTNPVRLRWLVTTSIKSRSTRVLSVVDLKDSKFDVRVQVQSPADRNATKLATEIVEAYYQFSDLFYEPLKKFNFGTLRVPKKSPAFINGLYERYTGFNKFELAFAEVLDKTGHTWHRNPSSGGFHIPLLSEGDTTAFYPDFIVWKSNNVYCLDTKGGHLLGDAVTRKLFDIKDHDGKVNLLVRFISEGNQKELRGKTIKGGYTVWKMKSGKPTPVPVSTLEKSITESLK